MGIRLSIVLLVIGGLLVWAIDVGNATLGPVTINWQAAGLVLMAVGAFGLLWSLYFWAPRRDREADPTPRRRRRRHRL